MRSTELAVVGYRQDGRETIPQLWETVAQLWEAVAQR